MKLFVYGTLKRGERNNHLLTQYGAKFLQKDLVQNHGVYGPFPVACYAEGVDLEGEVWDNITTELWERLDALESGYKRTELFTLAEHKVMIYLAGTFLRGTLFGKPASKWAKEE